MITTKNKIITTPNVLSREQCAQIIDQVKEFKYDILKRDLVKHEVTDDKETIDKNTLERNLIQSAPYRRLAQFHMENPVFASWDGKPVYACKVMKYRKGEFVTPHRDAHWMCLSNYWVPDTNMSSDSLIIIPLNDTFDGGDLSVGDETITQTVGTAIQFNCNPYRPEISPHHGVSKVTEGTRYSLVFWNFS